MLLDTSVLIVAFLMASMHQIGLCAEVEFLCPETFMPDAVNTLTLRINQTAVDAANCVVPLRTVSFDRKRATDPPSSISTIVCKTPFNCSGMGPVPEANNTHTQCGCVQKSGEIRTFQVKVFVSSSRDKFARFDTVNCIAPEHPLDIYDDPSCSNVTFAENQPDENQPNQKQPDKNQPSEDQPNEDQPHENQLEEDESDEIEPREEDSACSSACIGGIVGGIGLTGGIILIIVGVYRVKTKRKREGDTPEKTNWI